MSRYHRVVTVSQCDVIDVGQNSNLRTQIASTLSVRTVACSDRNAVTIGLRRDRTILLGVHACMHANHTQPANDRFQTGEREGEKHEGQAAARANREKVSW
jgi:hypothetical protein